MKADENQIDQPERFGAETGSAWHDPFALGAVLNRIHGMGIRKVTASTQYGMGFIIVEQGPREHINGIVYRNDTMTHSDRQQLAEAANVHLAQNDKGI